MDQEQQRDHAEEQAVAATMMAENLAEATAGEANELGEVKGYARILALATTDALCLRLLQPDDVEVVAYAMAKLGHRTEAATVLMEYGKLTTDEAVAEVAAMVDDQRGVWGYTRDHGIHGAQRYHLCGKAFTEDGEDGEPEVLDCTEDYGHEGPCSQ